MKIENSKLKVVVLTGGISTERDVSLQSGRFVFEALEEAGVDVVLADVSPESLEILEDDSIDVFFIALHGRFGEDGQLQQILEDKGLVYTGSGPEACRLAIDKMASKAAFNKAGVATAAAIEFKKNTDIVQVEKQLRQLGEKFVVKPISHGSSVGVNIVTGTKPAIEAAWECLDEFGDCMIERFIPGREVTVGILAEQPLPIIEIKPKEHFYSYKAKYIDEQTEHLFDTIENRALAVKIQIAAMDCFNALGCQHFARVDFIVSEEEIAYALEVNTIPGLTPHSNIPLAAKKVGLSMSDLCVKIIGAALENRKSPLPFVIASEAKQSQLHSRKS